MKISELEPKKVFQYFEEILEIPRPSKKEEKIVAYLEEFAKKNNLECETDKVGNVLIKKPATKGYENYPTVILQSHLDMVPEKRTDVDHNFETDPIKAFVDDDGWIKTYGTTLGGDDGIGIAASMAVLTANNLKHPPIEALFTADEETGMTGAFEIEKDFLNGKIFINLDSEDEGEIFIGSAGGMDSSAEFNFRKEDADKNSVALEISIDKLHGGHSGDEIDKGYANSIQLLNRFLWNVNKEIGLRLSTFEGGKLRNAIPKDAKAIITIEKDNFDKFKELFESPHGVYSWDKEMDNLVETSTNLATIKFIDGNKIKIGSSQRSSVDSSKFDMGTKFRTVFELAGAEVKHNSVYPGWKPNTQSPILKVTEEAYKKLFGNQPIVRAIHAGLECGLFLEKYPNLDMISFGPTIRGAHTPLEKMEISTVKKFWDLLVEVLEKTPKA